MKSVVQYFHFHSRFGDPNESNSIGFRCFGIEPDLEDIMRGDFRVLEWDKCQLPTELILRWAWESWRAAISPAIAADYFQAINLMNEGARNNRKY